MKPITAREKQVALLIADGFTNNEIADHLGISARTVKAISDQLRWKLGVDHRRQIGAAMRKRGIL